MLLGDPSDPTMSGGKAVNDLSCIICGTVVYHQDGLR